MNSLSDSATITIQINNVLDFQDNLIAYYSFNGDASDNGPFQNHADIYNAQLTTDRYGQAMCAYDFDGEGDYMVIPHQDYLDFEAVEDTFSISFWIKSDQPLPVGATSGRVLQKWNGLLQYSYPYSFQFNNDVFLFAIFDKSNANSYHFGNIWDDQWHHIVVTVDGQSKTVHGYLDGNLAVMQPITLTGSTKNDLEIIVSSKSSQEIGFCYKGVLDDIAFHGRILREEEISKLF